MGTVEAARAKSKRGKDAGSARSQCATGATEDAASRSFAAGRAGRIRDGDHYNSTVSPGSGEITSTPGACLRSSSG
ncbi:MAG: hypothetical protein WD067_03305, partial [Gaiellaceae bacterium]